MLLCSLAVSYKELLFLAAVLLLLTGAFVVSTWWRAQRALEKSASQTAASGNLPFTLETLNARGLPGLTAFSTTAEFHAAAEFQGDFYICRSD